LLISDVPFQPIWIPEEALRKEWNWDGTMLHVATDAATIKELRSQTGVSAVVLAISGLVAIVGALAVGMPWIMRRNQSPSI
jgi:hypothetical protein